MAPLYLPEEILIYIFSRLPTKSIGKFRCLSKSWCALLSTTHFIKLHLTRKSQQENLILINRSFSSLRPLHTLTLPIKDGTHLRDLELLNTWAYVVDSCNGLVLLKSDVSELFVVNPITLQHIKIPDSPLALEKESYMIHGFGYDCFSDDYKIVILPYYEPNIEHEPVVDVYSLKTGVWRRVNNSLCGHVFWEPYSGAFLKGAIHWLVDSIETGYPSVIAAFDLVNEVFYEIPAPKDDVEDEFYLHRLVVIGGRLCLLKNFSDNRIELWMMKEYGVVESWTISSFNVAGERDPIKPICFIGEEEVLLLKSRDGLLVFNLKERTLKDLVFGGVLSRFRDGHTFVESLVSPFFNTDLKGEVKNL